MGHAKGMNDIERYSDVDAVAETTDCHEMETEAAVNSAKGSNTLPTFLNDLYLYYHKLMPFI